MKYIDIDEDVKGIVVGDIVKVNVLKYKNFRGQVIDVKDNIATIEVPTYYGNQEPVIIYRDIKFLKPLRKGKR